MFKKNNKKRRIKKIFQWREYLYWKKMTSQQKINFKRACLFPILALIVYNFLSKFTYSILLIILIYLFVRFRNRGRITK